MQPAAYGILNPGIVVRIHGGEPCPSHFEASDPSFRFGVTAIWNLEVNLSPQWTPYGARRSVNGVPPLSRCAGTALSGKGAASAFGRAERDATGDYANRVGDGLQNRAWLGSTPAIASHRIRAKRDGYMPPLVSGFAVRRQHAGQGAHHHRRSRHTTVHMVAVPHRRHLRRRNGLPIARRTRLRSSVGQSSIPIKCRPLVQAQPQALGASFLSPRFLERCAFSPR